MSFTLWLKAGADGVRMAGDPAAHHLFMLILLKSGADSSLTFDVKTINEARAPAEFKEAGLRHTPALQIAEDVGLSHEDDILQEIEQYGPRFPTCQEAEDATADLFRQFAFFIKDVNKDPKALLGELKRIDNHLESADTKFLTGDSLSNLDCLILPRLHSIRVAGKALKEFDIPTDLKHLWEYMKNGYDQELFKTSCPCDQEIILHWAEKPGSTMSSSKKAQLARQKASYSHNVIE